MALGLALSQTLAVDLGFDDDQVAFLSLWTTICQSAGCVIGGWLWIAWAVAAHWHGSFSP